MNRPSSRGSVDDQRVMSTFHYQQELRRTIRFFGSFAVAFSFISITTGIFANYKLVLESAGPAGIWTWPIVTVGQLLVALVFADLSAKMPLTGYSYQWVTRLAGSGWGWFTGWVSVCFLIIVIPSVDHGIASVVGHIWEIPDGSVSLKVIICCTIGLQALIHIFGVRLANRINSAAVFTEVVGMVGLVVIFAILAVKNETSIDMLFERGIDVAPGDPYFMIWIGACLMGAYTIVGFESAANLSEETMDASQTVPKAVIWSVVVSGGVGTLFLIVTVLGINDLASVVNSSYPLPTIIETNLGEQVSLAFFVLVIISIFACGLIIMASGSRMIYAMARDNVFIGNSLFRRVSTHTSAPIPAIVLVAVLGIVAEVFSESLEQLLLAAAVLPALIYLITVVAYAARRRSLPTQFGRFSLGRWGTPVASLAIAWLVLIIAILTRPDGGSNKATWVSLAICAVGVAVYFGWIRGRIIRGEAGVHAADVRAAGRKPDK